MIVDRLIEAIEDRENPTALGLDTRLEYLPERFAAQFDTSNLVGASGAILAYNKALVDGLKEIVPCVKVQAAYYEMYGHAGPGRHGRNGALCQGKRPLCDPGR